MCLKEEVSQYAIYKERAALHGVQFIMHPRGQVQIHAGGLVGALKRLDPCQLQSGSCLDTNR